MKLIIEESYEKMSRVTANILLGKIQQDRPITVGYILVNMYEYSIGDVKNKTYFDNVHYYNFAEIPFAKKSGFSVTMSKLNNFFKSATISSESLHPLD